MCGIFAVVNDITENAGQRAYEGLKRLEYRGYDSWGIATQKNNRIRVTKQVGKIGNIKKINGLAKSTYAIAHTRWATTGGVTQKNAHPHFSTDKSFVLAQNGIVENYAELKKKLLKKGYKFVSETDTEVVVRLIEDEYKKTKDLLQAVRLTFLKLEGRNTIIILTNKKNTVIAARNGSPLVVGISPNKQKIYLSSDVLSFAPWVKKAIIVENGQIVHVVDSTIDIFTISSGKKVSYKKEKIKLQSNKVDKEGYGHFMLKEIHESPFVISQLVRQKQELYQSLADHIKKSTQVYCIGSGTAGIAAAQIAFYLRDIAKINAVGLVGADARDYFDLFKKTDLIITPSQSGETADVLEVLEYAKKKSIPIASFVNMPGSMITRMSNFKFMSEAGPEICVMSTKIFISQITWGYLVSKTVIGEYEDAVPKLKELSSLMQKYLKNMKAVETIRALAKKLLPKHDLFLLGKYQNFQIVREGMVKLIEGTYKHAHGIPSGDLKHYAITLMEKGVPVIALLSNDKVRHDVINSIDEVKARGAEVIGVSPTDYGNFDFWLPVPETGKTQAIMNIIPLQLLAYYVALELGNDIDKPRNIAKSVTVK